MSLVLAMSLALAACATAPEEEAFAEPAEPQPVDARMAVERIDAERFPVDVVVNSSDELPDDLVLAVVDDDGRTVATVPRDGNRFRVLASGLVAGEEYRLDLRDDSQVIDSAVLSVDVEMPAPRPVFPPDGYRTIDPFPHLAFETVEGAEGFRVEVIRGGEGETHDVAYADDVVTIELSGEPVYGEVIWRARQVRGDGLLGPASAASSITITREPPLDATPKNGKEIWATEAFVSVSGMNGAAEAELDLEPAGSPADESADESGEAPGESPVVGGHHIEGDLVVFRIAGLIDGESYRYRVRGKPTRGEWTIWSDWLQFTVVDFDLVFLPVVSAEPRRFTMGYDAGFDDESPAHAVELTRPYALQDAPLTNAQVARLVNVLIAEGAATTSETGVSSSDRTILRLGELDYGSQFGLLLQEGLIAPAAGRADHPAIGISWYGAVILANRVSRGIGLKPAYALGRPPTDAAADGEIPAVHERADGDQEAGSDSEESATPEVAWNTAVPAVRLPTEAEWALAARGETETPFPWGIDVSGNRANYYRSFDPREDVNFPFTGNGGPTVPIRFFDGTVKNGFRTLANRSPSGHWDVVGNVWEWCWDWYDPDAFAGRVAALPTVTDPTGPESGEFRVVRGCAWNTRTPDVRVTNRGRFAPTGSSFSIGVRLAVDGFAAAEPADDQPEQDQVEEEETP